MKRDCEMRYSKNYKLGHILQKKNIKKLRRRIL